MLLVVLLTDITQYPLLSLDIEMTQLTITVITQMTTKEKNKLLAYVCFFFEI